MGVVIFVLGCLVGVLMGYARFATLYSGQILVRSGEPGEQPYLFLELSKDVHKVLQKKIVVLEVNLRD